MTKMASKWVPLLIHGERQSAACWALLVVFVCLIVYTREVFRREQGLVVLERLQSADAQPMHQSGRQDPSRMVQFDVQAGRISVCRN